MEAAALILLALAEALGFIVAAIVGVYALLAVAGYIEDKLKGRGPHA